LLTHHLAGQIVQNVQGVVEAYVWLCSKIGQPINRPSVAAAQVTLEQGVELPDVRSAIEKVIEEELTGIHEFTKRLIRGELSVW